VHSDSDRLSGFRPGGLTLCPNSDRRYVVCFIGVVRGRPITDVVPSVQPEGELVRSRIQDNTRQWQAGTPYIAYKEFM
jgi:hypothetical protein